MGLLEPDVRHGGRRRESGLSEPRKTITFHSLRQAQAAAAAAAETGVPLTLLSAPSAAASAGPAWFNAVTAAASQIPGADIRATLDCGSMAGHALAALRHGLQSILCDGPAFDAVADIARQTGASVSRNRPTALDLGALPAPDDEAALRAACRAWLLQDEV